MVYRSKVASPSLRVKAVSESEDGVSEIGPVAKSLAEGQGLAIPKRPYKSYLASAVIPERAGAREIRRNNLELVLRHLALLGPCSRAAIAHRAGLTRPTVSRLVAELMELRLVREVGTETSSSMGRPGTRLEIDGRHRLAIGCEVNLNSLAVIVTDLAGRVQYHLRRPVNMVAAEPGSVIDELAKLCQEAVDQLSSVEARGRPVEAIGIAVPGSVDQKTSRVSNTPNLRDWSELALVAAMRRDLGAPDARIIVDNDASFAALAEYWTGPHAGTLDFVHVTGDVGIGGGAVIDGRLLLSSGGRAGAVGHMVVDANGPACSCGRRGCWESFIGLNAFLSSLNLPSIDDRGPEACLRPVVSRARLGDPVVLDALTSLGRMLGLGAANLINLLGSDVVILGGYFAEIAQWILPAARAVLRERVLVTTPHDDLIVTSTLGFNAAALGAALQAANQVLSDPILLRLT